MNKKFLLAVTTTASLVIGGSASAQVENVLSLIVHDPAAQMDIMDAWFESDDSDGGQKVTLLQYVFNGADPNTHVIVADFPDYESWEGLADSRGDSAAWRQTVRASAAVSETTATSLMLHVTDNGESWSEGDYLAVIPIQVSGRGGIPTYVAAFNEMLESDMGKEAPGLVRLIATRAGNPTTHIALIVAPSFAELNAYLDYFPGTEGFQAFVSQVDSVSQPQTGQIMRVVKVWHR